MNKKRAPRLVLADIRTALGWKRNRAKYAREVLGYKSSGAYRLYEHENWGSKKIPNTVLERFPKRLLDTGSPKLTMDLLKSIATDPDDLVLSDDISGVEQASVRKSQIAVVPRLGISRSSQGQLLVVGSAKRGVFAEMLNEVLEGDPSPLTAVPGFNDEDQFVVRVDDDHAEAFGYPKGALLHCTFPEAWSAESAVGRKAILWSKLKSTNVGEWVVCTVHSANYGSDWTGKDADGKTIKGRPLGLVIGGLIYDY